MTATAQPIDIIGVGSPILDTLIQVEDAFLAEHVAGSKGGMELMDAAAMAEILRKSPRETLDTPGGSAGNTIFAMSRLGMKTSFLGKLGNDEAARVFLDSYEKLGGDISRFKTADHPNARCLSLVTPDSERTMRTMLGASALLEPDEIHPADFEGARHVHAEGYLFFNPALMKKVLQCASEAGCTISVDLASFEVVEATRDQLPRLLNDYVDIVFANEDEASAYFPGQSDYEEMARSLSRICEIAVVKLGAKGSLIANQDHLHGVDCFPIEQLVDTTGAGDLWASGFLTGWLRGQPLPVCGQWASRMGGEIVQVMGAQVPENRWKEILDDFS